mgnify:CR=1 FL=1
MVQEPKKVCRTPTEGREGTTSIPLWKYELVRRAILEAVETAEPDGFPFKDLPKAVEARLSKQERAELGSIGWHTTTVKLEMEVAGDLKRSETKGPPRLRLSQ